MLLWFLEKVKNSDPQKTVSQLLANSLPTVDHAIFMLLFDRGLLV